MKYVGFLVICFVTVCAFRVDVHEPTAELIVHFKAYVHGEPLELNKRYKNPFGETFEISRFRFYAGKIAPTYTDSSLDRNPVTNYKLIDFSDSSTTIVPIKAREGMCNGIRFDIGIDSLDQVKGAQSGVLDPGNGMFWTWNSGYQSFKIEGSSPSSSQPAKLLAYHIGGYRYPYSTIWKIRMNTTNDQLFRITRDYKIYIDVPVELDYFFDGAMALRITENASCTTPGEMARKISENFVGSFTGLTLSSAP